MGVLEEVGTKIQTAGFATADVDLFFASRPETPDSVVTLFEYAGAPPEYTQESPSPTSEVAQIQVMGRGLSYPDTRAKVLSIWSLLASVRNAVLSGTKYRSIVPNSSPMLIGRDQNDRFLIGFNATIMKDVS